jgi:hypothetical protein
MRVLASCRDFNPTHIHHDLGKRAESNRLRPHHTTLHVLPLESRRLLYNLAGSEWADTNLTYSFMPDGTLLKDRVSTLYAHMDAQHSRDAWQGEFRRALAEWASHSPLTFTEVADDGSPQGTAGAAQGDARFGDIRIGAASYEVLAFAWYPSSTTRGGDITFSTRHPFSIGSPFDLFSLALHESGHSLGLKHSDDTTAAMSTTSTRVLTGLAPDDIAGIQAIYPEATGDPDICPDGCPDEPPPPPPPGDEPTKPGKGKGGRGKLMDLFSQTPVSVLHFASHVLEASDQ